MSDESRFQDQQDAQNAAFKNLIRAQDEVGQEPLIPAEDLALLSDLQRRVVDQRPYGVSNT